MQRRLTEITPRIQVRARINLCLTRTRMAHACRSVERSLATASLRVDVDAGCDQMADRIGSPLEGVPMKFRVAVQVSCRQICYDWHSNPPTHGRRTSRPPARIP